MVMVCFSVIIQVSAQKRQSYQAPNLMIEAQANYGFLMAHHLEMQTFNNHIPSFEVSLARSTYGKQYWEALYNYPVTGVNYWTAWLGDKETMGKAHAVMPFISFPILKNETNLLNFRLAAGVGYLTKRFDRLNNYKYIAIGSHVNAAVNLMVEYRWKPVNHLQVFAGIQLMHFSNGSVKTPNFGLNIPSIGGGMAFRINKENTYIGRSMRPALTMFEFDGKKFLELKAGASFGIKDVSEVNHNRYNVMSGYVSLMKSYGAKSKFGIGLDLSYDGSDAVMVGTKGIGYHHEYELIKPGVAVQYELVLSRLSFPFALGFYTGGKYKGEGMSYYKIGMQYLIYKDIFATITLKTHFARADYVAFGMGYRFRIKHYW